MNKKGFTLIELLAVIVILAIIALIATPIVLDIINDSRNSSQLRSADFYLDAVEYAVSQAVIDNKIVESGTYNIIEDGNVCLQFEGDKCKDILEVDVSGGVPKEGSTITIIGGQIKKVNLQYEQSTIMKNQKGELAFFKNEYEVGDLVFFIPGDVNYSDMNEWYVIGEDIDTVTLILRNNLGNKVQWYYPEANNNSGPITALNYLNTLTTEWTNVDPVDDYIYINNEKNGPAHGYHKLEIKDGTTIITSKTGEENQIVGETKARLITLEEIVEISKQFNENFKEENLIAYLERHLDVINNMLVSNGLSEVSTVDEFIEVSTSKNVGYSKYMIIYFTVKQGISLGVETTYDLKLPEFLYQNLTNTSSVISPAYWTQTSTFDYNTNSFVVKYDGEFVGKYINNPNLRVRPVITIPKTKLK